MKLEAISEILKALYLLFGTIFYAIVKVKKCKLHVKLVFIFNLLLENETKATLEEVLCFVTASEKLPPLGFEVQPQIEFLHHEEFFWPKANTCVPILYLPVSYRNNEYEIFRDNMDYAILNGMQFGFA